MKVPVTMNKAHKYAVYDDGLTDDVRTYLMKNFGCARKLYNLYVDDLYQKLEACGYEAGSKIPKFDVPLVTKFKEQYPYMEEVDSLGLMNARQAFISAVEKFNNDQDHVTYRKGARKRAAAGNGELTFRDLKGMPRFHSRARGYFSYTTNCLSSTNDKKTVRLEGDMLFFPKVRKGIRLVVHRPLPAGATIKNVTLSMDTDGRFYASILIEYTVWMEMDVRNACIAGNRSIVDKLRFLGLDYSQEHFYVDSEGRKANCPKSYRRSEEKLSKLQHKLSNMQEGSSNYQKQLRKIQGLHVKIRNQRQDFVNKEASRLADEYDVVVVEDIDLRTMGEALSLGKNLHDNGFGMFRTRLMQKLLAKGSILVKVPRSFPSTKTCNVCGYVNREVVLGVKSWVCPECGAVHDRDFNAAVNIKNEGIRIFLEYFREYIAEERKAKERAEARSNARKRKRSAA